MTQEHIKLILSITATTIAVISYIPYIQGTLSGKIKPHSYSWFIWAIVGYIAGFGQLAGGGGIGALVALVTATISLGIAVISYKEVKDSITTSDKISLVVSLSAIPLWLITNNPLWSIILVSIVDGVAFWPSIRKAYNKPWDEGLPTFLLSTLKHVLTVFAQKTYNVLTVLYPLSLAILTGLFVIMLIVRRTAIPRPKKHTLDNQDIIL